MKQARYQPRQRRALRLGARRVRAFHVADSALSRLARASRDQVAQRQTVGAKASATRSTEMEQLGEHCSRTERRADEATREVAERLKCVYLKERVGETFDVVISSVVAVRLVRALARGSGRRSRARDRVAARLLPSRTRRGRSLKGERSGREYRLTETLKVRLAGVNVEERKIDFVPVEDGGATGARAASRPPPAVANRSQHIYGLHAVRAVLERRPETVLAAKVLRDASGKLAELARRARGARRGASQRVARADLDRLTRRRRAPGRASSRSRRQPSSRSATSRPSSSSAAGRCGCSCSTASRTRATSALACARRTRPASMPSSCRRTTPRSSRPRP